MHDPAERALGKELRMVGRLDGWDGKSERHAAAMLLRERDGRGLADRWSIAELELTAADIDALLRWARTVDGGHVLTMLRSIYKVRLPAPSEELTLRERDVVGLVLLAAFTASLKSCGQANGPWQ